MRIALLMSSRSAQARIERAMTSQGIEIESFATASALIASQNKQAFAAILVEDSTQRIDEQLTQLRPQVAAQTTIIVVGEGGAASISRALAHGADDYAINCDMASEHLVQRAIARVSVKLRATQKSTLHVGTYSLDPAQGTLHSQGRQAQLTSRELALARLLFEQRNQVVSNDQLCRAACERIDAGAQRAVKQHVYELRRKLAHVVPAHGEALRIETVYGKGYRLAS